MKFTLAWLREHLETSATLDEILFALTDLGLEVEGVTDPGARLAAFTVGELLEAAPHPDADKLRVCRVLTRDGEKQIVCGAPNARAGIKVVVAAPGDYIPGIDTVIKVGKIRGVESFGMMLSEREMELSDAHTGIVELDPAAPVGAAYVEIADIDPVIEIGVTPNRPDALGVAGIARDLAARGVGRLITPAIEPVPGGFPSPVGVYLAPDVAAEACPLFAARLIRGVTNGPSPRWLQDRLRAIGLQAHLRAGRRHELPDLRPRPAAARLRRRPDDRADHGPARAPGREAGRARRQDLRLRRLRDAGLRRARPREHRRRHGRRAHRRHRGDDERHPRGRLVRPDPDRAHRPAPAHPVGRALPLRARRRPDAPPCPASNWRPG